MQIISSSLDVLSGMGMTRTSSSESSSEWSSFLSTVPVIVVDVLNRLSFGEGVGNTAALPDPLRLLFICFIKSSLAMDSVCRMSSCSSSSLSKS